MMAAVPSASFPPRPNLRSLEQRINRRHRESNREILLSGITAPSAADLVNGLPKAADIIAEVTLEISANNEADLKELDLI